MKHHADLLDAAFWQSQKKRIQAGHPMNTESIYWQVAPRIRWFKKTRCSFQNHDQFDIKDGMFRIAGFCAHTERCSTGG
jgi:hypothetical protein